MEGSGGRPRWILIGNPNTCAMGACTGHLFFIIISLCFSVLFYQNETYSKTANTHAPTHNIKTQTYNNQQRLRSNIEWTARLPHEPQVCHHVQQCDLPRLRLHIEWALHFLRFFFVFFVCS